MHDTRPGGLDPQRIAVGGESAGGNLTVALCLYVRDNSGPAIGHQSVYYPFTDTSVSSPTLSPATVITCGHDVLHTDGVRLVEALRAAGVETLHTHYADMPHGFPMFTRLTRRADESMNEMAREVTKRLGTAEAKPSPGPRLG